MSNDVPFWRKLLRVFLILLACGLIYFFIIPVKSLRATNGSVAYYPTVPLFAYVEYIENAGPRIKMHRPIDPATGKPEKEPEEDPSQTVKYIVGTGLYFLDGTQITFCKYNIYKDGHIHRTHGFTIESPYIERFGAKKPVMTTTPEYTAVPTVEETDEEPEIVETFNLTLNKDFSITRDDHEGFKNLGWHIERNGVRVLDRNASGERTLEAKLQWLDGDTGYFTIYLTAVKKGKYVRVSNIIEYELEESPYIAAGSGLVMLVNGKEVPVIWENTDTVLSIKNLSKEGLTIKMSRYDGQRQGADLDTKMKTKDSMTEVSPGDIVLFSGNRLVICYGRGSGIFTKIGKIDLPEKEIKELFSKEDVTITLKRG